MVGRDYGPSKESKESNESRSFFKKKTGINVKCYCPEGFY